MKTRSDNRMARLKGRVWNGMPATDFLLIRLDGEDGEPAWTLREAAARVSKKIGVPVSEAIVSAWGKAQRAERRNAANVEMMIEATAARLAEHAASGLSLDDMVDAQIIQMIARVQAEDGTKDAMAFIKCCTGLKRALTADREQRQGVREYEESVEALKRKIEALTLELKARGFDPAALDALNQRTVAEIDAVILGHKPGKPSHAARGK